MCRSSFTQKNFYPRPPGGGRPPPCLCADRAAYFYPRPPGGGRHHAAGRRASPATISIHALRVEGDRAGHSCRGSARYFYPRPPGGGRHNARVSLPLKNAFLSTPSGWRATLYFGGGIDTILQFLSTPSGWRATAQNRRQLCRSTTNFYPRPPGGGRLRWLTRRISVGQFLSTPSGWRATE